MLLGAVRSHWRGPSGCENRLHWVLDMAFREDEGRFRAGHAAHNLSRRETTAKGGIAARRKQAGWNDGYLLKVLSNWNAIALGCLSTAESRGAGPVPSPTIRSREGFSPSVFLG